MVRKLGKACGDIKISSWEARALTDPYRIGCSTGCLFLVTYIIREFLREIFFWIDIQQGLTMAAETYYYGYLLSQIFSANRYQPGQAIEYGKVIKNVITKTNTDLVKHSISDTIKTSKNLLKSISGWLLHFFWFYIKQVVRFFWINSKEGFIKFFGRKLPESVRAKIEQVDFDELLNEKTPEIHNLIDILVARFQVNLTRMPKQHFDTLKDNLFTELSRLGL